MAKLKDTDDKPQGPTLPQVSEQLVALAQQMLPAEAAPPFATSASGVTPQFPLVEPAAPFYLVFVPARWDVIGGRLLPVLARLSGVPGANGVGKHPDSGQPTMGQALAHQGEQGRIVIPHDVDGPGRSYLRPWQIGWQTDRRTKTTSPIYSWHTRWEQLFVGTADIVTDVDAYAEWLHGLIARGVLPQPPRYVFERLRSFYASRIATYRGKANGTHPLIAEYESRLKVIEAGLAAGSLVPAKPADVAPELA